MQKRTCCVLIGLTLLAYLALVLFFFSRGGADRLPEGQDQQRLVLDQVEYREEGDETWTTLSLPTFVNLEHQAWLRVPLNYQFSGYTAPALFLQANHFFMTFSLDGEEIYRVEERPYSLGNYLVPVPLPAQADGALLEVCIQAPEGGLHRIQLPQLVISDSGVYLKGLLIQEAPSLVLNLMLLFCAVLMFAMAFVDWKRPTFLQMLIRGTLALNCAIYFMCETCTLVYLSSIPRFVYLLDLFSFAMLGTPLLLLIGWDLEGWSRTLLRGVAGLGLVNAGLQLILALSGRRELRLMLPATHIVQILGILSVLCTFVFCLSHHKQVPSLYMGSFVVVGGAVDLALFLSEHWTRNVFFLKICLLIYLFLQIYAYIRGLMARSAKEARAAYYQALAMRDPLTGCYSRAAFELDRADWDRADDCMVFSIDLNNLKQTNDTYGHSEGDRLISVFGQVLLQVFSAAGKCYRLGGDEFWVLCRHGTPAQAQALLQAVRQEADAQSQLYQLHYPLTYAVGTASTSEARGNLDQALELADQRMYYQKRLEKGEPT